MTYNHHTYTSVHSFFSHLLSTHTLIPASPVHLIQGREETHSKAHFHHRPDNNRLAIRIRLEILDGEHADNLDDGDKEAQGEEDHKSYFLPTAQLEADEDWEGKADDEEVEADGGSSEGCSISSEPSHGTDNME